MVVINAENGVFGRICSYAAKQALQGKNVIIVNSEKAIITGNKKDVIGKYKTLRAKGGHSLKGPRVSKQAFRILKRGVRGMLPDHRRGIGKQAIIRVKCYDDIPEKYQDKKMINFSTSKKKFITLKELCEKL
jgi:large subunit ribosomal protein L13